MSLIERVALRFQAGFIGTWVKVIERLLEKRGDAVRKLLKNALLREAERTSRAEFDPTAFLRKEAEEIFAQAEPVRAAVLETLDGFSKHYATFWETDSRGDVNLGLEGDTIVIEARHVRAEGDLVEPGVEIPYEAETTPDILHDLWEKQGVSGIRIDWGIDKVEGRRKVVYNVSFNVKLPISLFYDFLDRSFRGDVEKMASKIPDKDWLLG